MSIFPKRTKPGGNVTIHLGFGASQLINQHQFTFVDIAIRNPQNVKIPLYKGHILSLPIGDKNVDFDIPLLKAGAGLRKNVPYLLIADYLGGNYQKEQVLQLLKRLHNGKHFYFTKTFDKEAALGKYIVESTFYTAGEPTKSKTILDDYFFLEHLIIEEVESCDNGFSAQIFNPSTEITPAIIVECFKINDQYKYVHHPLEFPANELTPCFFQSDKAFLLYNEQREVLPLIKTDDILCVRNQKLSFLNKIEKEEEKVFVFDTEQDKAYELEGDYKKVWDYADGLITKSELMQLADHKVFNSMVDSGLIVFGF